MPRVYVVNKSGHDFSPAREYGDLIFLSEGRVDRLSHNQVYRMFAEELDNSSPEDYLLPTGLPMMIGIAWGIMSYKHGRVNVLEYIGKESKYVPKEIVISNLLTTPEWMKKLES